MRLTLRCLLATMSAIECSLDEVVMRMRSQEHWLAADKARKQQSDALKTLSAVLDAMTDSGEGE